MRRKLSSSGRERPRAVAGLVLAAGLVLSVSACGGTADAESRADDPAVYADAEISVMKICSMVDLAPLLAKMKTKYATGPTDISKGVGVDPAGPQCEAQVALPKVKSGANSPAIRPANARLNVSVPPYNSADYAATEFDTRIAQVRKHLKVQRTETPLTGTWTEGVLINGRDKATNRVYAMVRKDSYLLKLELSWETDAEYHQKFPFSRDDVATVFRQTMVPFFTAVSAKAEA